jgi:hypothetical protein
MSTGGSMSTFSTSETPRSDVATDYDDFYEERGSGWIAFSGTLLMILGTLNVIQGIAAIGRSHFFAANAHYVFGDLKTWGWVVLIVGVLQLLAGLGVFARNQFARWGGVGILSVAAIAQLLMMPAYPFWSLALFAVDILAIYGLVAYGKRLD